MNRFSLKTLLAVVTVAVLVVAFYREPIARFLSVTVIPSPLRPINTQTDMEKALASPNAVIFANVDWSLTSAVARKTVGDFAREWHRTKNNPTVSFYLLDLTDASENFPPHVNNWLQSDTQLMGLPDRGSGDVVWLKNGVVQKWLPVYDKTTDNLNEQTQEIFKNQ
jgi:hypothetical protein